MELGRARTSLTAGEEKGAKSQGMWGGRKKESVSNPTLGLPVNISNFHFSSQTQLTPSLSPTWTPN